MKKLTIKDGRPPDVATARRLFEAAVKTTPTLANTPLGIMEINGQFSHYMDADTDTFWIGFALGLRCAERICNQDGNCIPFDRLTPAASADEGEVR